jgi:hypothetical protein
MIEEADSSVLCAFLGRPTTNWRWSMIEAISILSGAKWRALCSVRAIPLFVRNRTSAPVWPRGRSCLPSMPSFRARSPILFCVVRPGGRHASVARGMGFCLYDNIAIAARYAQERYAAERILIVDWDVPWERNPRYFL